MNALGDAGLTVKNLDGFALYSASTAPDAFAVPRWRLV
jgi:hypothetical protein